MPSTAQRIVFPKPEEFLGTENDGEWRHEFVNGVIYAMAGGSESHNLIAGNIAANLKLALPLACRTFSLDMKLGVSTSQEEHYYYPDVFVTCSPTDQDRHVKVEPLLVIEVLSPNTARTDRGEKFAAYKLVASLIEYVLVEQDFQCIEIYRKRTNWQREIFEPGATIALESVGQTLTFEQIYRQIEFPAA